MSMRDKATGAYEPFVQIPPRFDCRGPCPEPDRASIVDLMYPALFQWLRAQEYMSRRTA